ncbi:hypothetical protein C8J56DRAFT_900015 [Mycena floridula]|nr:hypothetical protein C8J56DRAFT_900015 [Mycena floridula]
MIFLICRTESFKRAMPQLNVQILSHKNKPLGEFESLKDVLEGICRSNPSLLEGFKMDRGPNPIHNATTGKHSLSSPSTATSSIVEEAYRSHGNTSKIRVAWSRELRRGYLAPILKVLLLNAVGVMKDHMLSVNNQGKEWEASVQGSQGRGHFRDLLAGQMAKPFTCLQMVEGRAKNAAKSGNSKHQRSDTTRNLSGLSVKILAALRSQTRTPPYSLYLAVNQTDAPQLLSVGGISRQPASAAKKLTGRGAGRKIYVGVTPPLEDPSHCQNAGGSAEPELLLDVRRNYAGIMTIKVNYIGVGTSAVKKG